MTPQSAMGTPNPAESLPTGNDVRDIGTTSIPPQIERGGSPGTRLRAALDAIRDQLGFETACLFAPAAAGRARPSHWHLVERRGPMRPWHAVLDPALISVLADEAMYPNARALPGVGPRLAGLGCGSVMVLSAGDARLVLDSSEPKPAAAAAVDADLIETLLRCWQDVTGGERAVPGDDLGAVDLLARTTRRLLETPWPTTEDLLSTLCAYLEADGLFLLVRNENGELELFSADRREPDVSIAVLTRALAQLPDTDPIPADAADRIARLLMPESGDTAAAWCDPLERSESLVASWSSDRTVSSEAFCALARIVATFTVSVNVRRRLVDAQVARERTRWIQDIHDGVTQAATAAVIQLENLRNIVELDPRKAAESLDTAQQHIRDSLADLREMITGSRVPEIKRPRRSLEELINDVVERWRLPARTTVTGDIDGLPEAVVATALFIVREALTNAAKHSSAKAVYVRVMAGTEGMRVLVRDSGRGFDMDGGDGSRGRLGVRLMRMRTSEIGGSIDITSAPGQGTKVSAFLPTGRRTSDGDGFGGTGS